MKSALILPFIFLLSCSAFAQVKFNLRYQEDTKVYTVSVLPETTWAAPKNIVGAAQIVLRVGAGVYFSPVITPLVDGTQWMDNAYVEPAEGVPGYTFVCINLTSGPAKNIELVAGQEVALFSFVNAGGGCAGPVEILTNDDPMVQAVRANGQNITQNFAVLGAKGNAFSGIANGLAECAAVSAAPVPQERIVGTMQISPVPADQRIMVRWENLQDISGRMEMVVTDHLGRETFREKVSGVKGENAQEIIVKDWASGVYKLRFQLSDGRQTKGWNLMVSR